MSGASRILLGVLALQSLLLMLLVADAVSDRRAAPETFAPAASTAQPTPAGAANTDAALVVLSEQLARIEARLDAMERQPAVRNAQSKSAAPTAQLSASEISAYVGQVTAHVNRLSTQEVVGGTDLDAVMVDIARMPPSARTAALAELNRAINSGRINARF